MLVKLLVSVILLATQAFTANVSTSYHYETGLNSTAYQQQFDELLQHGYRLTYVSAYIDEHNQTLFSGLWKNMSTSVPWIARHGLTGPQYDTFPPNSKAKTTTRSFWTRIAPQAVSRDP